MKRKLHALLLLLAMAAGLLGFVGNQPTTNAATATKSSASELLSALPASDAIVYVNAQKILNETIPNFLGNRPNVMAKIRKEIDEIKNDVGIDPNTIDTAVVSMNFKTKTGGDSVVAIVRGRFNATEAIDKGFARAEKDGKLKRHETVYEGRAIYYLKRITTTNAKSKDDSVNMKDEVAVVVLDSSTLAVSNMQGVRAVIDAALGRNKVSDELVALATRNPSALISFSGNAKAIDEVPTKFGNSTQFLDGINQFYGSLWTSTNDVEGQLTLRTNTTERANELRDGLNGLKMLFSSMGGKGDHQKMIKDILNTVTISLAGNEVEINGKISNSHINFVLDTF